MRKISRTLSRKAVVYATAGTLVLGTATVGMAAGGGFLGLGGALGTGYLEPAPVEVAQSATANVVSAGTFFIEFKAKKPAGVPETGATGFFSGAAKIAGTELIKFSGPITCLNVSGNNVGIFYPITKSNPAAIAAFGAGVFIYLTTDGKGQAVTMTFLPAPTKSTDGCAPLPGLFPATGKVTLKSG